MRNNQKSIIHLYQRDLDLLFNEIEAIPEDLLWEKRPGIINSCGVLAQHLVGNLRHYIGASLGNTGYEREREREFTNTGRSKEELLQDIEELKKEIKSVLSQHKIQDLKADYPGKLPFESTVYEALIHLYGHLNYHLGQINYLRRMIE